MFGQYARHNYTIRATLIFLVLAIPLALTACQKAETEPPRDVSAENVQVSVIGPTLEPYQFKTSDAGTASVHGKLIVLDPMSLVPASDDAIYLVPMIDAEISTIPQFEPGTVPQADVDERTGEFMFTNIQPGQYAVVVMTKGGAQIPARFYQADSYGIFKIDESQLDTVVELNNLSLP